MKLRLKLTPRSAGFLAIVAISAQPLAAVASWQQTGGSSPRLGGAPQEEGAIIIDPNELSVPSRSTVPQLPAPLPLPSAQDGQMPAMDLGPDQKVVVRERYAGWKQANRVDRAANLDDTLRANWVMLTASGLLTGQVVPGQGASVDKVPIYLLHRGKVVNQTRTDADGAFVFNNMEEGTYSIVGFGDNAFFAFGFNALDYRESTASQIGNRLEVMAVENKSTINLDWIRYFAPGVKFRVYGRFDSREGTEDPTWLYGLDGLATHAPAAVPSTAIGYQPTALGPGGHLVGRIHQIDELNGRPVDIRSMRVMLLKDNDVAAAVSVDNFGVFEFHNVVPGQYAVVAVGADGMACIGIDAREGLASQSTNTPDSIVDLVLVSPETIGWLNHTANETAYQRIINRPMNGNAGNNNCVPCMGDLSNLYRKRRNFFGQFFESLNCYFDLLFYGETTGNCGGFGAGAGVNGCNPNMGVGFPGGCNQCGGAGCQQCHPGALPGGNTGLVPCCPTAIPYAPHSTNPPAPCGGCGQPHCSNCHPELAPATSPNSGNSAPQPTPALPPQPISQAPLRQPPRR